MVLRMELQPATCPIGDKVGGSSPSANRLRRGSTSQSTIQVRLIFGGMGHELKFYLLAWACIFSMTIAKPVTPPSKPTYIPSQPNTTLTAFPPGLIPPAGWSGDYHVRHSSIILHFKQWHYVAARDPAAAEQAIREAQTEATRHLPGNVIRSPSSEHARRIVSTWRCGLFNLVLILQAVPDQVFADMTWGDWSDVLGGLENFQLAYPHVDVISTVERGDGKFLGTAVLQQVGQEEAGYRVLSSTSTLQSMNSSSVDLSGSVTDFL